MIYIANTNFVDKQGSATSESAPYWILDEKRQLWIDINTGEVLPASPEYVKPGSKILSPEEIERRKEYRDHEQARKEKEAFRLAQIKADKEVGPFVVSRFERDKAGLKLSPETLARLFYLATYSGYDGRLMKTNKTQMDKAYAKSVMRLSPATFYRFWREITSNGILIERKDGFLYLPQELFYRGKFPRCTGYDAGWVKVYIRQMRRLYELTPPTKHCYLGAVFAMMPYINQKYNVLCRYPLEEDIDLVEPIGMAEFCRMIGKSESNADSFRKSYQQISLPVGDTEQRFCTVIPPKERVRRELIFVNPRVLFMGKDWKYVENLILFFQDESKSRCSLNRITKRFPVDSKA